MLLGEARAVGELDAGDAVAGSAVAEIEGVIEGDLIACDAVGQDQGARTGRGDAELGCSDARAELEDGGAGGTIAVVLIDLHLAVAGVVDEGVGAAVALLVGGVAAAVEGVRRGRPIKPDVGGRAGGGKVDQLLTGEAAAIGELHGGDAIGRQAAVGKGHHAVKLDLVAGNAIGDVEIAGPVRVRLDLRCRDARPELEDVVRGIAPVLHVDLELPVTCTVDNDVVQGWDCEGVHPLDGDEVHAGSCVERGVYGRARND